jgi:hypothetical protein
MGVDGSVEYAKKNDVETLRHTVEEAMTEALLRTCVRCSRKFYKEEGVVETLLS